jgi:hypothetical protein
MAPAAEESTAPPALSSAGWFFQLPELEYGAGSVVPDVGHLVLVAQRALCVVMREDAQSESRLATIAGGPEGVGPAGLWPRYGVYGLGTS